MQKKIIIFVMISMLLCLGIMKSYAYADAQATNSNVGGTTTKVFPKSIALVQEDVNDSAERIKYYEEVYPNGSSNTVFTNHTHEASYNFTDLEVGYLIDNSNHIHNDDDLYVVLDLDRLPKPSWDNYREISSVELQATVNPDAYANTTTSKTYLTVASCNYMSWYHYHNSSESYLNDWRTITNQSCYYSAIEQDSVIVNRNDLPMSYRWDVTDSVKKDLEKNQEDIKAGLPPEYHNMTFVFFGTECQENQPCLLQVASTDLVQFFSYEVSSSQWGLGRNLSPIFVVTYTETPTLASQTQDLFSLSNIANPSNLATIGTAIVSGVSWVFREEIKKHAKTLRGQIRGTKTKSTNITGETDGDEPS